MSKKVPRSNTATATRAVTRTSRSRHGDVDIPSRDQILEHLREHGTPMRADDLATALGVHGAAERDGALRRFAAEAWRRADAGELANEELYPSDAAWAGIFDRFEWFGPDEYERRLVIAAEHGERSDD